MTVLGFWAFIGLLVLQLLDKINIPWWQVSAPLWGCAIFDFCLFIILPALGFALFGRDKKRKNTSRWDYHR